jgi:hypothetical protein
MNTYRRPIICCVGLFMDLPHRNYKAENFSKKGPSPCQSYLKSVLLQPNQSHYQIAHPLTVTNHSPSLTLNHTTALLFFNQSPADRTFQVSETSLKLLLNHILPLPLFFHHHIYSREEVAALTLWTLNLGLCWEHLRGRPIWPLDLSRRRMESLRWR